MKQLGTLVQVEAYWQALYDRRGAIPLRDEIVPSALGAALPNMFLAAPGGAAGPRLRVAGSAISDLMGMEARTMPLAALIVPGDRARALEAFAQVQGGGHVLKAHLASTHPGLQAALFAAPVVATGKPEPYVFGALQWWGQIGPAPNRFTLVSAELFPIGTPARAVRQLAEGFAEPAAPFAPAPSRSGHLRLVHDAGGAPGPKRSGRGD